MPIDKIANPAAAANLYANTANKTLGAGMSLGVKEGGNSFSDILKSAATSAIDSIKGGEQMSAKAITGEAELTDVVQAVTNAELTLQTVVAVRDRMISAYQEIMRMPI